MQRAFDRQTTTNSHDRRCRRSAGIVGDSGPVAARCQRIWNTSTARITGMHRGATVRIPMSVVWHDDIMVFSRSRQYSRGDERQHGRNVTRHRGNRRLSLAAMVGRRRKVDWRSAEFTNGSHTRGGTGHGDHRRLDLAAESRLTHPGSIETQNRIQLRMVD